MSTNGDASGFNERLERLENELRALRARVGVLEGGAAAPAFVAPPPKAEEVYPAAATIPPPPVAAEPPPPIVPPKTPPAAPPPLPRAAPSSPIIFPQSPRPQPAPAAAAFAPPRPAAAPRAAQPDPVREFLRAVHLLPPSGPESHEVQIGAWWATRIGALLAVIGVVFFGVYVSLNTPPWVKLAELAAVSVGIALGGAWLDRRALRVGSVVLGAGLALIFFTAFAAYAIPAVKVTDSIAVALVLQAAAVALVYGVAVRRDSPTVATMAALLGYVSAFFSIKEGFDDIAVGASLALAIAAMVFRRWRGWIAPLAVAAVLTHAVFFALTVTIWDTEMGARSMPFVFAMLAAGFGVVLASVVWEGPDASGRFAIAQRWIQSINGSLAAIVGFAAATVVLPRAEWSHYFFAGGAVFTLAAIWAWRRAPADLLFSSFAVKASALLTIGVATEWDQRTRWLVLGVESAVLLAAGWRTKRVVLFLASFVCWLVSLVFFMEDAPLLRGALVSASGVAVVFFLLASAATHALTVRWWPPAAGSVSRVGQLFIGLATAVPVFAACGLAANEAWSPLAMAAVVVALLAIKQATASRVPIAGAAVALLYAHGVLQFLHYEAHGLRWIWATVATLTVLTAALGWVAAEIRARRSENSGASWRTLGAALHVLALSALFVGIYESGAPRIALAATTLIAAAVAWAGATSGRVAPLGAGVIALGIGLFLFPNYRLEQVQTQGAEAWMWLGAVAGVLTFAALGQPGAARERLDASRWSVLLELIAVFTGAVLVWAAAGTNLEAAGFAWSMIGAAAVYFALGVGRQLGMAFVGASALLLLVFVDVVLDVSWPPRQNAWPALAGGFAAALALAALPVAAARHAAWLRAGVLKAWRIVFAVLAAVFVIDVALTRGAPWHSLASVVCALGGIAVFVLGLFFRARTHRIAGLVLLGFCVLRAFAVDINSMLYRVAAFVVLGIVLLWVGFSYQRFRHLIEDDKPAPATGNPPPPA